MVWGYEGDYPFEEKLAAFRASGLAFQVCPGTSSWNSVAGRVDNALENVAHAARAGHAAGARGLLATDWGDRGHLQPAPISEPGWIADRRARLERRGTPSPLTDEAVVTRLGHLRHSRITRNRLLGRALLDAGSRRRRRAPARRTGPPCSTCSLSACEAAPPPAHRSAHPRRASKQAEEQNRATRSRRSRTRGTSNVLRARSSSSDDLRWAGDLLRFACALGRARLGRRVRGTCCSS